MGKTHPIITEAIKAWVADQQMFFVASAPLSASGHVNCSPKGIDSLRITGPQSLVYQDLTGSGVETIAHVKENTRILIMLCAFAGPPQIVRFHGSGQVHTAGSDQFDRLADLFPERMDCRAYISVAVHRIATSCGYSVPLYDYVSQRDVLDKWADNKGPDGLSEYRSIKNTESIDGLPGI